MALEAQNNPYPSVLMVEASDPEAISDADPAVGQRRLIVGDDGLLYLLDSTGTATAVGAGSGDVATDAIWAAKGDLAVGTAADTAAILTAGANDTVLMADSGQSTGLKWVASQTPSTQAFSDLAAEGTADTYARGDHVHGMPANPGGGGLALLEQHTASSSASLDFTTFISSTYDEYAIEIVNLIPATDNVNLLARVGTGAGPSYQNTLYSYAAFRWSQAGSAVNGVAPASSTAQWDLSGNGGIDFGTDRGVWGDAKFFVPQSGSLNKKITWQIGYVDNSNNSLNTIGSGMWISTTVVTALQFFFSSGNIASGTVRIYGVAK